MSFSKISLNRPINTNDRNNFSIGNKTFNKSEWLDYRTYSNPNRIQFKQSNPIVSDDVLFLNEDNILKDETTYKDISIHDTLFGIGNIIQPLSFPPSFYRYF